MTEESKRIWAERGIRLLKILFFVGLFMLAFIKDLVTKGSN